MRTFGRWRALPLTLAGLAFAAVWASADNHLIQGRLVFVDEQGAESPAVGVEITCEETARSDTSRVDGLFRMPLPDLLRPGDHVRLEVQRPGWRVWRPVAGEITIPAGGNERTLGAIRLLPTGSKALISDAAIEQRLLDAARKSREQVKADGRPEEIQLSRYVTEWAMQDGFAPEEAALEVDRWIVTVQNEGDDLRRLSLAEFARGNFDRAGNLAAEWAARHDPLPHMMDKTQRDLRRDAVRAYRLAGDARYSGYRFEEAMRFYRKALAALGTKTSPETWAALQDDVGRTAHQLGLRAKGAVAQRYFDASLTAHRAAVAVRAKGLRQQWVESQIHLGLALYEQGTRTTGQAGRTLLAKASQAYSAALEVDTRERAPQSWATVQSKLGIALQELGNRTPGEAGPPLLEQAADAYHAALSVYTRYGAPQQWAAIQKSLGGVLQDRAHRIPGEAAYAVLGQAVAAYQAALEVYTRTDAPEQFAKLQNDLGTALEDEANRSDGEAGQALRSQAAEAYSAAVAVDLRGNTFNVQHLTGYEQ